MLGKKGPAAAVEGSTLVSTGPGLRKTTAYQRKPDEKPSAWCDYCNKPRHTRETCWKIHGKPAISKAKQGIKLDVRFLLQMRPKPVPSPKSSWNRF